MQEDPTNRPFKRAKGQQFQDERHWFGEPGNQGAPPPRDLGRRAVSVYRGGSSTPEDIAKRIERRQADFFQLPIVYTTTPTLILPASSRIYFLLQNLDLAFDVYLGFGTQPNQAQLLGLRIAAGQAYEPYWSPQNDIWITGTGTGKATLLFASSP